MTNYDEPACWSWEVPAHVTLETLLAEGKRRESDIRFMLRLPGWVAGNRFNDFHANRCAACGRAGVHLAEDHCHETGQVRGYLCRSCNTLEGVSAEPLFVNYRRRHPAAILGFYQPYAGRDWVDGWYVGDARFGTGPRPRTVWPVWDEAAGGGGR